MLFKDEPANINVVSSHGGTVSVDKNTAKYGETVTVTYTADDGYYLNDLTVVDSDNNKVDISDCLWYTGNTSATFTMPKSEVTITPKFATAKNLSVNMPVTGTKEVALPDNITNFKIFDDGGADGIYSNNCDGNIHIKAPKDRLIRLEAFCIFYYGAWITVYDGASKSAKELLSEYRDFNTVSSGSDLFLNFTSGMQDGTSAGFECTVDIIDANEEYLFTIEEAEGGTVTADKTKAKINDTVTLTITPKEGYIVDYVEIVDEKGANLESSDYTWYDGTNTMTFKMTGPGITVKPVFSDVATTSNAYGFRLPANGDLDIKMPATLSNFAIYKYSNDPDESGDSERTIKITCPEGKHLLFYASIGNVDDNNKLTIYDGDKAGSVKLLETDSTDINSFVTVRAMGNSATIVFRSSCDDNRINFIIHVEAIEPLKGDGTAGNPYIIKNSADWTAFAEKVNGGETSACAKLTNRIEIYLNDTEELIGTEEHPYSGTFDGQGYNVSLNGEEAYDDNEDYIALFRWISGATIKNVTIDGEVISTWKHMAGR